MKTKRIPATPVFIWLIMASLLVPTAGINFSDAAHAQSSETLFTPSKNSQPQLSRYTVDLTQLAAQGKLEPVTGFDAEINRVIAELTSSNTKAPALISESDGNRAGVARAIAMRIVSGNVPEPLRGKRLLSLSLDALANGAKTTDQFEQRLQSVFVELAQASNGTILFVDQLHQYAGSRATVTATATIKSAISSNGIHVIAGATPAAFDAYIATDESVAKLFESIPLDGVLATATTSEVVKDKRRSPINEEFVGEKISPEMRNLIRAAGPNGHVSAILQVSDVNSREVRSLLARNGILLGDSMASLGTLKVDLPARVIEALMKNDEMNFISPDVTLESFGHVTATTGTDQIRNSPGLLAGLLGASAVDGTGVGIAVIDSGLDTSHGAFTTGSARIKFSKDFTGENITSADPYGHGTHVAGSAAGASYSNGTRYQGIAPGATIINLRVLNSKGTGSTSGLLNALNWILSPADPTKAVSSTNPRNKDKYNIRIINLSLGAPAISSYKNDPICRAARALVDAGVVVVAAAGNNGKDANGRKIYGAIHSPGNEPSVITVGAANSFGTDSRADDDVATYSSRGPTR
ncbi:MAG TPA: S8 family serine peptidase, partial [Pyrinomonadaceae bacterium]|nr:S8 family serine peptidase [Pyrinomonadaceae bacterium]